MALNQKNITEYHINKSQNIFRKVKPNLLFDVNELLLDKNIALESINFRDDKAEDKNTNDDISDSHSNIIVVSCRSTQSLSYELKQIL